MSFQLGENCRKRSSTPDVLRTMFRVNSDSSRVDSFTVSDSSQLSDPSPVVSFIFSKFLSKHMFTLNFSGKICLIVSLFIQKINVCESSLYMVQIRIHYLSQCFNTVYGSIRHCWTQSNLSIVSSWELRKKFLWHCLKLVYLKTWANSSPWNWLIALCRCWFLCWKV